MSEITEFEQLMPLLDQTDLSEVNVHLDNKLALDISDFVKPLNSSGTILYVVCNRLVVVLKYARNGYPFVIYILDPVFMGFFFCWKNKGSPSRFKTIILYCILS